MTHVRPIPVLQEAAWRKDAACATAGRKSDEWFSEDGQLTRRAKAVCRTCPVQAECLAFAVEERQAWGVWGGLTAKERLRELVRGR